VRQQLLNGEPTNILFLSGHARPLSASALSEIVQKAAIGAGLRTHITCHLWRHTCATHMLQNGANLRHVQEMLGHRRLETTQRYLHLTIIDLKRAHHQYHPRELGIARARRKAQNNIYEAETANPNGSPANTENRALVSQPDSATACSTNEIPISQQPCT
jgi:integrase/recombinase XerD